MRHDNDEIRYSEVRLIGIPVRCSINEERAVLAKFRARPEGAAWAGANMRIKAGQVVDNYVELEFTAAALMEQLIVEMENARPVEKKEGEA